MGMTSAIKIDVRLVDEAHRETSVCLVDEDS